VTFKRASRSHEHEAPLAEHPFMNHSNPYENAIAVDETCMVSTDTPLYGWAPKGTTVPKPAPRKRSTVSSLVAMDKLGIVRRMTMKGSFNSLYFATFLTLLPRCKTILLDNVNFHKSKIVRDTAAARSQTLVYTPPYCPWFNPVEHLFSCCKHEFRRRRFEFKDESFMESVDLSFDSTSPLQCEGAFRGAEKKWRASGGGRARPPS
jgi:transposase